MRGPSNAPQPTPRRRHNASAILSPAAAAAASLFLVIFLRLGGEGSVTAQPVGDDDGGNGSGSGGGDASYPDCDGNMALVGDALCDFDLNVDACGFDGGDCCECTCIDAGGLACGEGGAGYFCLDPDAPQDCGPTGSPTPSPTSLETSSTSSSASTSDASATYPGCGGYLPHMGDGFCDEDLNTAACGFDGGDCCACTCGGGTSTETNYLEHSCGYAGDGFDCRDPDVPDDCGATPSPADSHGYPDCTGYMYGWQDSYCDYDLNNEECGWDGGDCCPCTCREYSSYYYTCGYYGYDCMDPEAPSTCSTESPTPSPAAGTDYPECDGYLSWIGDGFCDSSNNNEECGWDGGDCCPCTCDNSDATYTCGVVGYNCLDPTVSTGCETTSTLDSDYYSDGYSGCSGYASSIGDGYCDSTNNNEECGWDDGDCCPCTCDDSDSWNTCGEFGYDCLDPTVSTGCETTSTLDSDDFGDDFGDDATSAAYCPLQGDGKCDVTYNSASCDWDGGDCCSCDCLSGSYKCGISGYECLDPSSSCSSGTPSPASTSYSSGQIVGGFSLASIAFCCFGGVLFAACSGLRRKCWGARRRDEQDAGVVDPDH